MAEFTHIVQGLIIELSSPNEETLKNMSKWITLIHKK